MIARMLDGLALLLRALTPLRGTLEGGERVGTWQRRIGGSRPLEEVEYEAGVRTGERRRYDLRGVLRDRTMYRNGLREGPCTRWAADGSKRCVGEYRGGEMTGEWFFFGEGGQLDTRRTGCYEKGLRYSGIRGFNDQGRS